MEQGGIRNKGLVLSATDVIKGHYWRIYSHLKHNPLILNILALFEQNECAAPAPCVHLFSPPQQLCVVRPFLLTNYHILATQPVLETVSRSKIWTKIESEETLWMNERKTCNMQGWTLQTQTIKQVKTAEMRCS